MSKIRAENITKRFEAKGHRPVTALDGVNLEAREGEFISLLGPSGCGKSTFLYMVGGFVFPTSGTITVNGRPVTGPGTDRGITFQEFALFPWRTVIENVAYGLEEKGIPERERLEIARRYLKMTNLSAFEGHFPKQLSGGMKQRVAIARMLAYEPEILLMDEPFGALDAQTRSIMQEELMSIWQQNKKTVLFVTHSVEEAILLSDRVAVFTARPGRIKEIVDIDLPRPRSREAELGDKRFAELYHRLWHSVKEEVDAAAAAGTDNAVVGSPASGRYGSRRP